MNELDSLITEEILAELELRFERATHLLRLYETRGDFSRRDAAGFAYFDDATEAHGFADALSYGVGSIIEITELKSNVTHLIHW